jgi:hypothetical protein
MDNGQPTEPNLSITTVIAMILDRSVLANDVIDFRAGEG